MIERLQCPGCKSDPKETCLDLAFDDPKVQEFLRTYYEGRVDEDLLQNGRYTVLRCKTCGLLWQKWILDEKGMNDLYGTWIQSDKSRQKRKIPSLSIQYARHFARLQHLFPEPGEVRLLDYGMGWGEWCHMAQSFGFQAHGVELSEERIAAARVKGISASLPNDMPEGLWDFIYLEQVLEHLPTPKETLEMMIRKLKVGGYIHIGVPNAARLGRVLSPKDGLQKGPLQPLEHINAFSPASLKKLLSSLGCTPAAQREGLIRVTHVGSLMSDMLLAALRHLPASLFPPGTSLMFQKTH